MSEKLTDHQRFSRSYEIRANGCWEWKMLRNAKGYGIFGTGGRQVLAHRHSLETALGINLGEQCALHECDNPPCVNPAHLFIGDRRDNRLDAKAKGRQLSAGRGERARTAKLKESDIPVIRELRGIGLTYRDIGKRFGVFHSTIRQICTKQTWNHLQS